MFLACIKNAFNDSFESSRLLLLFLIGKLPLITFLPSIKSECNRSLHKKRIRQWFHLLFLKLCNTLLKLTNSVEGYREDKKVGNKIFIFRRKQELKSQIKLEKLIFLKIYNINFL